MNKVSIVIGVWLLVATAAGAVQLKPAPIQKSLDISLAAFAASDEFDQVNRSGTNRRPASQSEGNRGKSLWKAGLLSALVPGGGEFYLGHRKKARYFFTAEALTWIGYLSFRLYGNWKKDDFINYATTYANAQLENKDDEFHDMVGFYNDIDEFNVLGRVGDPDRPYLHDTPENHWRWESEDARKTYRQLKNSSRDAHKRSNFMIGVAIVTRVISVIDAVRDARRLGRRLDQPFSGSQEKKLKLSVNPFSSSSQLKLTLVTDF